MVEKHRLLSDSDRDEPIVLGEVPGQFVIEQLNPKKDPPQRSPLQIMLEKRPSLAAGSLLAEVKTAIHFQEEGGRHRIIDRIGLRRLLPGGQVETYEEKLQKEEDKGQTEAAAYGIGELDGNRFVFFSMHWDYFAGSVGVVVGEKLWEAVDLALDRHLPLVSWLTSSGVRQQENFAGLSQMPRMLAALDEYKSKSKRPYIGILAHQVWGGVSASLAPAADISVGLLGSDFGFSGPNVIKNYEQKAVPPGSQSAEAKVMKRNIDMLMQDKVELLSWLGDTLGAVKGIHRGKITPEKVDSLPTIHELNRRERFPFSECGLINPILEGRKRRIQEDDTVYEEQLIDVDDLYQRYQALAKDPRRPDTEYLLRQCFTDVVPLYSAFASEKLLQYPAIIAALGNIDGAQFLVIGNQPTLQKSGGRISKVSASPTPADFRYMKRMMRYGAHAGLPLVLFTDTLGAKPTIEAEDNDQGREIQEAISATLRYPHPTLSIITGALGSGGGLATAGLGAERLAMLENAIACVADPTAMSAILYKTDMPTREQVVTTVNTMRATAHDQLELGLIDSVIPEPNSNAWQYPAHTAEVIRGYIATEMRIIIEENTSRRVQKRRDRSREWRGTLLEI